MKGNAHPCIAEYNRPAGKSSNTNYLSAQNGSLPHLHLIDKNAPVGQAQHGTLFSSLVVSGIQVEDEHEIGHLLHRSKRSLYSSQFYFQLASDYMLTPYLGPKYRRYSVRHCVSKFSRSFAGRSECATQYFV